MRSASMPRTTRPSKRAACTGTSTTSCGSYSIRCSTCSSATADDLLPALARSQGASRPDLRQLLPADGRLEQRRQHGDLVRQGAAHRRVLHASAAGGRAAAPRRLHRAPLARASLRPELDGFRHADLLAGALVVTLAFTFFSAG